MPPATVGVIGPASAVGTTAAIEEAATREFIAATARATSVMVRARELRGGSGVSVWTPALLDNCGSSSSGITASLDSCISSSSGATEPYIRNGTDGGASSRGTQGPEVTRALFESCAAGKIDSYAGGAVRLACPVVDREYEALRASPRGTQVTVADTSGSASVLDEDCDSMSKSSSGKVGIIVPANLKKHDGPINWCSSSSVKNLKNI